MLSKEEIEKAKEKLNKFCKYEDNLFLQDEVLCEYQDAIETFLQYIDQLEQENKKLTHTNKSYKGMINKQNKIIDEMADTFFRLYQKIPGTMYKFF